jgi:glucosamine-phosphate N-acetyltransferase
MAELLDLRLQRADGGDCRIIVEPKLIHGCGKVAHLVASTFGSSGAEGHAPLLEEAKQSSQKAGCYKILASCAPDGEPAYARAGFKNKGLQMRYIPKEHGRVSTAPISLASQRLNLPKLSAPLAMRPLASSDYERSALQLLQQLTVVGEVSQAQFGAFAGFASDAPDFATFVIADAGGALVGIGTVFLVVRAAERDAPLAAHIEDIVVDERARGRGLGALLIRSLLDVACAAGAEVVMLECSPENAGFYSKLGFGHACTSMGFYFE